MNVDQDTAEGAQVPRASARSATRARRIRAGSLPGSFGVETMPTSFLIDRNGVIRYMHHGFREGDIEPLRGHIKQLIAAAR